MSSLVAQPQVAQVEVTSTYAGEVVTASFKVPHPQNAPDQYILMVATTMFLKVGGFMRDTLDGGMELVMASQCESPIKFVTKGILTV